MQRCKQCEGFLLPDEAACASCGQESKPKVSHTRDRLLMGLNVALGLCGVLTLLSAVTSFGLGFPACMTVTGVLALVRNSAAESPADRE
jgi:uncharacterized membrane-anchored protein